MNKYFSKISKLFLILFLITGWIFSGWPQIYNFPPKVQETSAVSNDATVEVLGGGGGGGVISNNGGGGGGGGEYRRCTETLSVQSYTVTVGTGGTADTANKTNSTFSGTGITMTAVGGLGTSGSGAGSPGTGGVSTNCDTAVANFDGGTPAAGDTTTTNDAGGGGGGGAGYAGKGGNGAAPSSTVGGGGGGGAGETAAGGNAGTAPGAGGAGAGGGGAGGVGVTTTYAATSGGAAGTPATYHIVGGGAGGGGDNLTRGGACGAPGAGSGGAESTGAGNGCRGEIRIVYVDSEVDATGGTQTTSGIYRIHTFTTSGTFTVNTITLPTAATPTYDNDVGTYNNDVTVTISDATSGATIKYCTDTNNTCDPTTGTTGTSASITATGTYLRAIATKSGYTNSAIKSALYTLQVANPSFGTNGGSFNNDTTSTQTSTTTSAVFCQTVDGSTSPAASTPGTCSTGTTGADATVIATGKTIKVLGTKANYVNSAVQTSSAFTLTVGAITSSPGAGTYTSEQDVTLNIATTTGAVAHYTTNGDAVTCSSTTYSSPFHLSATATVKAIGCKTNYVSDTAISDLYTLNLNFAPTFSGNPTDSPDPVVSGRNVTFSGTATDSSDNWYLAVCKTDSINAGSPPTCASSQLLCISTSAVGTGSPNTCVWASTGSVAQDWYAFACDNNASPMCSSSYHSTVTVNAAVISVSVSPTTTSYGMMATSGVRKANTANANDEFIVTNTSSNVEEDFDIIGSDATGGTGWTLSPTAVGSSIFMHAYSTLKTLVASFTLGSSGEQATKWVALDKGSNYRPLASNIAIGGTVDLILELLSPSSIGGGDYGVTKSMDVTIRATQH